MITAIYLSFLIVLGFVAGVVGSLTGLGGGVVLIPALTLLLGMPIEYAAGASLVSTIATSSGAASAYVKDRLANIRIGMSLEIATTFGAMIGALAAALIYTHHLEEIIFIFFGVVLLSSTYPTFMEFKKEHRTRMNRDWSTDFFKLYGRYYDLDEGKHVKYSGYRWVFGEGVMLIAGIISGLLGIGSGALKVIGMDWGMKLPIKVTTSTSNFMIGVTAAAGSAVYWAMGYIQPLLLAPILVGILTGSYAGSKLLPEMKGRHVRGFFLVVLVLLGIEMILRGVSIP